MREQSVEEAGSDAPTDQPGKKGKAVGFSQSWRLWPLNLQQRSGRPVHLSPPAPSLPHELKPRMSPFLQVMWVCQSSRTQWYRGRGLPANSTSSSVDMRRHEVNARGRHLSSSTQASLLLAGT